jgi:hypothetical protein
MFPKAQSQRHSLFLHELAGLQLDLEPVWALEQ